MFAGKPIIQYSIEAALSSGIYNNVIVSTDDYEIASIANKLGAESSADRPAKLSDDASSVIEVIKYEIENYGLQENISVTCLFACSPMILGEDLVKAVTMFESQNKSTSLMTIAEFPAPPEWALSIVEEQVVFDLPSSLKSSALNFTKKYFDSGSFYIYNPNALMLSQENTVTDGIMPFLVSRDKAVDIDTAADWDFAEAIYMSQFN
jgi:N-acylneuraminate cytidylyltransferase